MKKGNGKNLKKVKLGLQIKIFLGVFLSLLISSPISAYINSFITDILDWNVGVYINTIVSLLVTSLIIMLFVRFIITNPIKKIINSVAETTEGDLTAEINHKSSDELGQLVDAVNTMQQTLRNNIGKMVEEVGKVSDEVSEQSVELQRSANEVKEGSTQVASTMQELSAGAESQAENASDLSSVMMTFTDNVKDANENGKKIQQSSGEVLQLTDEGSLLMKASVEQMSTIEGIVKESVKKVQGLDTQSKEISKLVNVINDIAEQTNLLALNAAIEAARAGEHGKGFAVVADEVRKLAEQVSGSVTDISEIVERIQSESSLVVDSLQSGYAEVENGTGQIKSTGEKFEGIELSVKDMVVGIEEVTNSLTVILRNSEDMTASIQEIASISEESAAGIEETSASTEQTTSAMEEVVSSSTVLAELANNLNIKVRQFKV
ncbi:methyl-accepting chemotaxis protein [Halalkalibacillus sediminis]|uniref:Methyl-accepting chemotaxis protein n=1 Tax=Halalkalibacillus sediminis TaxID=2018042 RepID=A0A2I0QTK6_9BACI|nr:HAMP domain-containing methyl-accepting chemotaxis protein [Halalkalibacillus sediminis]PKR77677.1 methyl-accepting chemotaxis protein [Halalkalibacillus sediminis]